MPSFGEAARQYQEEPQQLPIVLEIYLNEALHRIRDVGAINAELSKANGVDPEQMEKLLMTACVDMPVVDEIDDVVDMNVTNNFTAHFVMYTGRELRKVGIREMNMPIPITADELLALRRGNAQIGQGKITDYRETPHFMRMLTIFPEFTVPLVEQVSAESANAAHTNHIYDYRKTHKNEFYVAYQLMSGMVDINDQGAGPALKEDGTPNEWFMKG